MALPKINSSPQFDVIVPSTGETIHLRPYLVKEEKVLMLAFESGEAKQATRAIANTLNACVEDEGFDAFKLTPYDIEYLFTFLRTKSVGETTNVIIPCKNCEHKNDVSVDLAQVKIPNAKVKTDVIKLTDDISVELSYPTYGDILDVETSGQSFEDTVTMVATCIKAVLTEDERIDSFTKEEIREFLESLTTDQFALITVFIRDIPKLEHNIEFECASCGTHNDIKLSGMRDFLS